MEERQDGHSIAEAASILEVSEQTVRMMVAHGHLKRTLVAGVVVIDSVSLIAYVEQKSAVNAELSLQPKTELPQPISLPAVPAPPVEPRPAPAPKLKLERVLQPGTLSLSEIAKQWGQRVETVRELVLQAGLVPVDDPGPRRYLTAAIDELAKSRLAKTFMKPTVTPVEQMDRIQLEIEFRRFAQAEIGAWLRKNFLAPELADFEINRWGIETLAREVLETKVKEWRHKYAR